MGTNTTKETDETVDEETAEDAAGETQPVSKHSGGPAVDIRPEDTIERPLPDEDEQEEEDEERVTAKTAEDAGVETKPQPEDTSGPEAATEGEPAPGTPEQPVELSEEWELPTLDTDHEYAAYTSGYRAGEDDPGWLLTLAEMRRHLGSFFTEEEETAFGALSPDDFWARWALGYSDAVANKVRRPRGARQPDEWEF